MKVCERHRVDRIACDGQAVVQVRHEALYDPRVTLCSFLCNGCSSERYRSELSAYNRAMALVLHTMFGERL